MDYNSRDSDSDSDIIETDNEVSPEIALRGGKKKASKKANSEELLDDYDIIPTKFTEYWIYTFTETSWKEYQKYENLNITYFENYNVRKGDVIFFYCKRRMNAGFTGVSRVGESQKVNGKQNLVKIFRDINMNTYVCPLNYLKFFDNVIRVEQIHECIKMDISGYRNALSFKMKFIKVQNCMTKMELNGRHLLTKLFDLTKVVFTLSNDSVKDSDSLGEVGTKSSSGSSKSGSSKSPSKSVSPKSVSESVSIKSTSKSSPSSATESVSIKSTSKSSPMSPSESVSIKSTSKSTPKSPSKSVSSRSTPKIDTDDELIDNDLLFSYSESLASDSASINASIDTIKKEGNVSINSATNISIIRNKPIIIKPIRHNIFEEYKGEGTNDSDPITISEGSAFSNGFKYATSTSSSEKGRSKKPTETKQEIAVSSDSSQYYPSYKESDENDDGYTSDSYDSDEDGAEKGDCDDKKGEGEEEDPDDDNGIIPILIIPCKSFAWPPKKGDMRKYFVGHYKTCTSCIITNNNVIELSSFIDKATIEIVDIEDEDEPYIEYPLEAYDNLKRHCPDDMKDSPFIRVAKINQCHEIYKNCLLVTGAN